MNRSKAAKPKAGNANASVEFMRNGARSSVPLRIAPDVAASWDYSLRNRRRWIDADGACREQIHRLRTTLGHAAAACGADGFERLLDGLRTATAVEVSGPPPGANEPLAWSIMPWEYALSALGSAERERSLPSLVVLRRVEGVVRPPPARQSIDTVLFVSSAPGAIGDLYSFDAERDLVHSGLDPKKRFVALEDPTLDQVATTIKSLRPDAIHVAGVDVHQGRGLLGREDPGAIEGMYLSDDAERPLEVPSHAISEAIGRAASNLRLVTFNLYNSAGRMAPEAVSARAAAAIGFQDEVDDRLAELFFGQLYLLWRHRDVLLEEAFEAARRTLSAAQGPHLRGSGVVLCGTEPWNLQVDAARRSAIAAIADHFRDAPRGSSRLRVEAELLRSPAAEAGLRAREKALAAAFSSKDGNRRSKTVEASAASPDAAGARPALFLRATPVRNLNYSMLHNRRPFFESLSIQRMVGAPNEKVHVEVALHTGIGEHFPWKRSFELRDAVHDFAADVHLTLISALWRRLRESVHTTLSVRVTREDGTFEEETDEVTLLPLDEWRDTDRDRVWLPSFVLSRDRAVLQVVRSAQRHLMALNDDRRAGFDGYQSVDPRASDPFGGVEMQARALWCALVHDHPLDYINPPPSFTELSQRLRSPTEIVGGGRGTCIDLALLYAACLEFVDVHPVLFIVTGHAFVGFWRSAEAYKGFVSAVDLRDEHAPRRGAVGQRTAWALEPAHYEELRRHVDAKDLVPVETVALTDSGSFADAKVRGAVRFAQQPAFCTMLDVAIARREGVTPLPMDGG